MTEYQTVSLRGKISNFEMVWSENNKLLGELEEIKIRRRNLAQLERQHDQEQQTLLQMVHFKFSRSDLRLINQNYHIVYNISNIQEISIIPRPNRRLIHAQKLAEKSVEFAE